jgi:hypothetical protein
MVAELDGALVYERIAQAYAVAAEHLEMLHHRMVAILEPLCKHAHCLEDSFQDWQQRRAVSGEPARLVVLHFGQPVVQRRRCAALRQLRQRSDGRVQLICEK